MLRGGFLEGGVALLPGRLELVDPGVVRRDRVGDGGELGELLVGELLGLGGVDAGGPDLLEDRGDVRAVGGG